MYNVIGIQHYALTLLNYQTIKENTLTNKFWHVENIFRFRFDFSSQKCSMFNFLVPGC